MASFIQGEIIGPVTSAAGYEVDITKGIFRPAAMQPQPPIVQRVLMPSLSGTSDAAAQAEKKRRANSLAMGAGGMVLTGGVGVSGAPVTTDKKLFGE